MQLIKKMKKKPIKGTLRSQLLEFVYYAPNKEGLVIDISFGTTGFGRSLAWAFRQVSVTLEWMVSYGFWRRWIVQCIRVYAISTYVSHLESISHIMDT